MLRGPTFPADARDLERRLGVFLQPAIDALQAVVVFFAPGLPLCRRRKTSALNEKVPSAQLHGATPHNIVHTTLLKGIGCHRATSFLITHACPRSHVDAR